MASAIRVLVALCVQPAATAWRACWLTPALSPPVCTQLLVSRPDEENITSYLQLIEKCLTHEVRPLLGSPGASGTPAGLA